MADRFDEELARLRGAWRSVEPGHEPGGELESEDARTRESVEWLRRAWSSVEPPAEALELVRRARRNEPRRPWIATLALAAAVLVAVILWPRTPREEPPSLATGREPPPLTDSDVADASTEPRVESVGPDQVVLRSGSVRLYLAMSASNGESNTETPR